MSKLVLGKYCPTCDHTYFSRARHDFRCCPCWVESGQKTGGYVDGGRDYLRCGGGGILMRIPVQQTFSELEQDWARQHNKFGLIKGKVGTEFVEDSYDYADKRQLQSLGDSKKS